MCEHPVLAEPAEERRRWDALPCDVLTHVVGLLRSGADQAAAAAACRAWQRVSDAALRDIRRAPLGQLPRLLARFPGATRATICDAASPAPPGGASAVAAALLACPRAPHALLFSASHAAAADGLFALATSGPAGAAWAAQLTSLELDLTFAMRLPDGLGAALPRLRSLELRAFRGGGHALGAVLGCARLRALRLAGLYCGALPGLEALTRLAAVGIVSCYNLREAPELPACVKSLEVRGCHQLTQLHLSGRLSSLTMLSVTDCPALFAVAGQPPPAAVAHAALITFVEWAAARLPGLGQLAPSLASLDLSDNSTLRRLPAAVSSLSRLARLALDGSRLDDCAPAGAGPALGPAAACGALEVLSLRRASGFPAASVPSAVSRLQRLQVLDLGGGSRLEPLPTSVADLPALQALVLPRGAARFHGHAPALAALAARGGGGRGALRAVRVRED